MASLTDIMRLMLRHVRLIAYPVGSYYCSSVSTDPHELFGGTWEQVKGRFIFACDSTHAAGSTGGEETHKLTIAEMPRHSHRVYIFTGGGDNTGNYDATWLNEGDTGTTKSTGNAKIYHAWQNAANKTWGTYGSYTGVGDPSGNAVYTGGDASHNNMPPYIAAYCWKRTA